MNRHRLGLAVGKLILLLAWTSGLHAQQAEGEDRASLQLLLAQNEADSESGKTEDQELEALFSDEKAPADRQPDDSKQRETDELFSPEGPSWDDEHDDGPRDDDEDDRRQPAVIPVGDDDVPQVIRARPQGRTIDEIIVTAQKREQASKDVPISMSVLDDDFIVEQGITDVREALLFVPNIQLETGSSLGGPRCRGFGLNIRNRAFEPPCGVAIDGVAHSSADYFNLSLFDVQRMEVLRGPQGTTFGKNTTAGVVHVITKSPHEADELEGYLNVQTGELDRRRAEGAVSGPLLGGLLNFRVAGLYDRRTGFLRNTTADPVPEAVARPLTAARDGIRAKLQFPDLFGSSLLLTYESSEFLARGFGVEAFGVSPEMAEYMRQFDPGADFEKGNFVTSLDFPEKLNIAVDTYQLDWSLDLTDWSIAAVVSRSDLVRDMAVDADYFPAPAITGAQKDRTPSNTIEVRAFLPRFKGLFGRRQLFGQDLGWSEFLGGLFYQDRDLQDGLLFLDLDREITGAMLAIDGGISPPLPLPPSPLIPTGANREAITTIFNHRTKTLATFAEYQWHFLERWTLQTGGRYSYEEKQATWDQDISDPHPLVTAAGWAEFTAARSRSETQFLPKISLNFKPTEEISLFARWTRGFKGGGFNGFSQTGESELTSLTFGPEKGTEWAFDAKMDLLDDTMRINLSFFRLNVIGFQYLVQVDDELTGFPTGNTVVNVGEAQAQGIEGDITYLPTDWLTIIGTIGLNDTEFIDFPFNSCPQDQENTDGDDDPRCDVSGRPFPFAPKWNNTLTTSIQTPLSRLFGASLGGLEFKLSTTVEHISSQFLNIDLGENSLQPTFFRYRASVGLKHPGQGWTVSIIGENLGDKVTSLREDSILGVSGNTPEPGRTVYGQIQMEF